MVEEQEQGSRKGRQGIDHWPKKMIALRKGVNTVERSLVPSAIRGSAQLW